MIKIKYVNTVDHEYLRLVADVFENGRLRPTRAKIDGKNVGAYTVFGRQARFNFAEGFPILTTKRIAFKTLAHELIWFLHGESNINYLSKHNVHIWDAWAKSNGELGYGTYGTMWRKRPFVDYKTDKENEYNITKNNRNIRYDTYKANAKGTIDQIAQVIDDIKETVKDPTASCGRRLIVDAWEPYYVTTNQIGLPPCHVMFQFDVDGDRLNLQLYQRSCDLFLGVPFNITSYCLLLCVIAQLTGLKPGEFIHTYGNLHIYENHVEQMKEQLTRTGYALPKLKINPDLRFIDDLKITDFELVNYQHDPVLKGEVAV
jgi:thymidylate synthase